MTFAFCLSLVFSFSFVVFIYKRETMLLLPNIFIVMNLIYLSGIIYLANPEKCSHLTLIYVHITGLLSFLLGTFFIKIIRSVFKKQNAKYCNGNRTQQPFFENDFYLKTVFAWSLFLFSILMGLIYYRMVGYNLVILGFQQLFTNGSFSVNDASSLRIAAYSGDKYFAPGYFNQFKNVIIVILWQYLYFHFIQTKSKARYLLLGFLPALFYFLLGTGQRYPFAFAVLVFVVFSASVNKKVSPKIIGGTFILFFMFFTILSAIQNRGITQDAGSTQLVVQGFNQMSRRLFLDNPLSAVYGFEYIFENNFPPQLFKETITQFKNILPIHKIRILTIDNLIHDYLHGSIRGTSPLSFFGYIWYDFRLIGVILFSFFLGSFYSSISLIMEKKKDLFVMSCWVFAKLVLGLWTSGGIFSRLDRGIITIIILLLIYSAVCKFRGIMLRYKTSELSRISGF